ncbi:MAG: calcium-binding protein [Polyangiaceae bacterium]
MNRPIAAIVAFVASSLAVACNVGVEGGGDGGAGGGADDGRVDDKLCTDPKPDCLYGVPSRCTKSVSATYHWECEPTPLVVAFDREAIHYTLATSEGFDLIGDGSAQASDWPTASTPWLALDRDANGLIDGGSELFGSAVGLSTGVRAKHGFEALAELDDNGDGRIDAQDPRFAELSLWADVDADRSTDRSELTRVVDGDRRILSIDLAFTISPQCDARGNCAVERASFMWKDVDGLLHEGAIVDVHLPLR